MDTCAKCDIVGLIVMLYKLSRGQILYLWLELKTQNLSLYHTTSSLLNVGVQRCVRTQEYFAL